MTYEYLEIRRLEDEDIGRTIVRELNKYQIKPIAIIPRLERLYAAVPAQYETVSVTVIYEERT